MKNYNIFQISATVVTFFSGRYFNFTVFEVSFLLILIFIATYLIKIDNKITDD